MSSQNPSKAALVLISSAFLALSACSFKKGGDEKTAASPEVVKESTPPPAPARPKNIFEALANLDNQIGLDYIAQADVNEVNSYNDEGRTPLMVVAEAGRGPYLQALLKKGALPLKPQKSGQNTLSTLELAHTGYISGLIRDAITAEKEQVSSLITRGDFPKAYEYLQGYYLQSSDQLVGENTFLDLLHANRALNPALAAELASTIVDAHKINSSETKKLWQLSFETHSAQLVKSLVAAQALLDAKETTALVKPELMAWKLEVLKKINQAGLFLLLDLSTEQGSYVRHLIDQKDGKLMDASQMTSDLELLEKNSAVKNLCRDCFEAILSARLAAVTQMKLIALLIETSHSNDPDFLAQILPRLSEKDARTLLDYLNSNILKTQKNVLSATAFQRDLTDANVSKLDMLRKAGFTLSPEESPRLFAKLFQASLDGQTPATKMLDILSADFIRNRASFKLTKYELQKMASLEVYRLLSADTLTIQIITVLKALNEGPFAAMLVSSKDMDGKPVELSVDFGYYMDQQMEEFVVDKPTAPPVNSLRILTLKDRLDFAFNNSEILIQFYLNGEKVILTKFDILIRSILPYNSDSDSALSKTNYIILSLLKSALANNKQAINSLFADETKAAPATKFTHRIKYIPAIIGMPSQTAKNLVLYGFINSMEYNFAQKKDLLSFDIISLLKAGLTKGSFTIDLVKSYLSKQNPRLFVAMHGKMYQYQQYVAGKFINDPLCKDKLPDTDAIIAAYRSENIFLELSDSDLKDLTQVCDFHIPKEPEPKKTNLPGEDIINVMHKLNYMTEMNNFYYLQLANDHVWISGLEKQSGTMTSYQFDRLDIYEFTSNDLLSLIKQFYHYSILNLSSLEGPLTP